MHEGRNCALEVRRANKGADTLKMIVKRFCAAAWQAGTKRSVFRDEFNAEVGDSADFTTVKAYVSRTWRCLSARRNTDLASLWAQDSGPPLDSVYATVQKKPTGRPKMSRIQRAINLCAQCGAHAITEQIIPKLQSMVEVFRKEQEKVAGLMSEAPEVSKAA